MPYISTPTGGQFHRGRVQYYPTPWIWIYIFKKTSLQTIRRLDSMEPERINLSTFHLDEFPSREIKSLVTTGTSFGITRDGLGGFSELSLVARGTGSQDRYGNVVNSVSLQYACSISKLTNGINTFHCRIIIVRWLQGYVNPTPSSFVSNSSFGILGPYNQSTARNYDVLYDTIVNLSPSGTLAPGGTIYGPSSHFLQGTLHLDDEITFVDGSPNSGDTRYFILFFGSDNLSATGLINTGFRYYEN